MIRTLVAAGACAIELTLSTFEMTAVGVTFGAITLTLAIFGALSAAGRISRDLVDLDWPSNTDTYWQQQE